MSDREDIPDFNALRQEACAWVVRIHSGHATTADTAEVLRWRAQSPDHARALGEAVRLRRVMVDAGRAARVDEGLPIKAAAIDLPLELRPQVAAVRPMPAGMRLPIGRRAFLGGAIAASVGGVMMVRPPLGLWPSLAELRSDYRTGTGERRNLALAKGVSIDMNTRTSIALRLDARHDGLELIAGEVAVEVAHPAKPVAIKTDAGIAVAQSGRFGVRLKDNGTCVTCSAGSVAITTAGNENIELAAGQQITFSGEAVGSVVKVDTKRVEAWRTGRLIFVDEPLSHVVDELNRYRPGKIILTNADLHSRSVNAVFLLNHLDSAVLQIREVAGAEATELPGGIVLLS